MTLRKLLPYLFTIILFVITYAVTQIISNDNFVWLYGNNSDWIEDGTVKLDLQRIIYTDVLACVLLLINIYEIIATNTDKFLRRLTKCFLTILIIYLLGALLYKIIDNGIPNIYEYRGGVPARIHFLFVVLYTIVGLIGLEIIKFIGFKIIAREKIRKYLPTWILEKEL